MKTPKGAIELFRRNKREHYSLPKWETTTASAADECGFWFSPEALQEYVEERERAAFEAGRERVEYNEDTELGSYSIVKWASAEDYLQAKREEE